MPNLRCYSCGKWKREVATRVVDPANYTCIDCLAARRALLGAVERQSPPGHPFLFGLGSEPVLAPGCLLATVTKDATLLGKRIALDRNPTRVGRGADCEIVVRDASLSRRHARLELRESEWWAVDEGSASGTYVNDEPIRGEARLIAGDRLRIGETTFKYLTGPDMEAQYHEQMYALTIMDGLTGAFNARYLFESLEREFTRARRLGLALSCLWFDIDELREVNVSHGPAAGDQILRELARLVSGRIRRDAVFGRYGGEEFAIILPETSLQSARLLAEKLRLEVEQHRFVFQGTMVQVRISVGIALNENAHGSRHLFMMAAEQLDEAKRSGRNRVAG